MNNLRREALIVDNDPGWCAQWIKYLQAFGYRVTAFDSELGTVDHIRRHRPHVAIVHFMDDIQRTTSFIKELERVDSTLSVIYPTMNYSDRLKTNAYVSGAYAVLDKALFSPRILETLVHESHESTERRRGALTAGSGVFVLMPFAKKFDDRFRLGIKEPLESIGIPCTRADEISYVGNVVQEVFKRIDSARLLIADMTGQNANVFYEVGYAHAKSRRVVLLTEKSGDIPFDLRGERHIIYGASLTALREQLLKVVKDLLDPALEGG